MPRSAARTAARDVPDLPDAAAELGPAVKKLRLAAGDVAGKYARDVALVRTGFAEALDNLAASLDRLATELAQFAERGEEIAMAAARADEAARMVARWRDGADAVPDSPDDAAGWIRWVDVTPHGFQLQASPLSVAPLMKRQVEGSARAWIFTSATLAVGRDFSHYTSQLGLDAAATQAWNSPFDYAAQALLYVPRNLPAPNSPAHTDAVVDAALPLLEASEGRAFLLFTTLRALSQARERIGDELRRRGLDYPLLVQGEGSRSELLVRFRELGNAILLGSASFWEGRGRAGRRAVARRHRQAAVRAARRPPARRAPRPPQGPGRQSVHGVAAAAGSHQPQAGGGPIDTHGDRPRASSRSAIPRLTDKPYGRRIWQSLPPMKRTREEREAVDFLRALTKRD
jgi:ATP-dependent DNA helicase DinG